MILTEWLGIVVVQSTISAIVSFFMQRYFFRKHEDKIDLVERETRSVLSLVKDKVFSIGELGGLKKKEESGHEEKECCGEKEETGVCCGK